jgi:hypothetical protein
VVAWAAGAVFFFYQYSLRSAPSVMMLDLSAAFGISTLAVASILGTLSSEHLKSRAA